MRKMRKTRKIKPLLIGIVIASMMLTGCKSEDESETASLEVASTVTGMIQSIEDKTITVVAFGNGGPGDMDLQGTQGGTPPDMNDGEMPSMGDGETPPSKPDGMPDDMSENQGGGEETTAFTVSSNTTILDESNNKITTDDLKVGQMVTVELTSDNVAVTITVTSGENNGMGGMPGGDSSSVSYEAVTEYTADATIDDENYDSTGTDENAIHVLDGANVTFNNITLTRNSSDSTGGDTSSFYGVGAGLLVTNGTVTINGGTFTTDAAGAAGIFSYGSGIVNISDAIISTSKNTSGGIHVAGGGTLYAKNLTVTTQGESSAAIRSDRGGGTMEVDGGTCTSNGIGSPAVYCTADIRIKNATLNATGSEAVCIEGLNSLTLTDCNLTGDMPENEQNDCIWTVILYQSMSGDSEIGNSSFSMTGGSLTSKNGGLFYTTNTESTFYISGVDLTYSDSNDFLLKCTGNSNQRGWGTSGGNGSDCTFTADNQEMKGKVIWDSISNLELKLTNGTNWSGAMIQDESNAGNGGNGYANLTIDESSTWTVTGDSTLTALTNNGTIVDDTGKTVTIKGTDGTVYVSGTSSYTITVVSYN